MKYKYSNLAEMIINSTNKYSTRYFINNYNYNDFYKRSNNFLYILEKNKIQKNDRICIIGEKCLNFSSLLLAGWRNGNVIVPINNKLDLNLTNKIIKKIKPKIIFKDNKYLPGVYNQLPLNYNFCNYETTKIYNTEILTNDINDPALILFTSGTTNDPKGVVLSHKNILSNLDMIDVRYNNIITRNDSSFSLLPWNHCYGLVCELLYLIKKGASIKLPTKTKPKDIFLEIRKNNPSLLYTVPKMLENIYKNKDVWSLLVLNNFRKKFLFGKNIRMISIGGSMCNPWYINYMYENFNLPIYQGYGLTETSPMISLNSTSENKIGSVGKILPGVNVELKKENDLHNIYVNGDNLMLGYLDKFNEDNSIELHQPFINYNGKLLYDTGDCGYFDKDKFLFINGRKKTYYKLSNGKYIDPIYVESILLESKYIDQIFVYGDGCKYNKCLIYVDPKKSKTITENILKEEINRLSKNNFENYEIPKEIKITNEPFSIENGCLSLKLDLKRNNIIKYYNL